MKTKIVFSLAAIAVLGYWALSTKNEVVESAVFTLKVKLGLAEYKTGGFTAAQQN